MDTQSVSGLPARSASIAVIEMELDKQVEPLAVDTTLSVRARSALGLKYVELVPGRAKRTFEAGTPCRCATPVGSRSTSRICSTPSRRRPEWTPSEALTGFGDG